MFVNANFQSRNQSNWFTETRRNWKKNDKFSAAAIVIFLSNDLYQRQFD